MAERCDHPECEREAGHDGYHLVMPEDGWDERAVSFYCDLCDRTLTHRSVYLNMDALIKMGMTQAECSLVIHRHVAHHWDGERWWAGVPSEEPTDGT